MCTRSRGADNAISMSFLKVFQIPPGIELRRPYIEIIFFSSKRSLSEKRRL